MACSKIRRVTPFSEADVKFRAGIAVGDEPHFGFRFAAEFRGEAGRRMDLDREVVAGVEHLDEDRETRLVWSHNPAPKISSRRVDQRSCSEAPASGPPIDDGLLVLAVHDFP